MKKYVVAYHIRDGVAGGQRDLGTLYMAIQSLETFVRPMPSVWVVCSALTAAQLYQKLAPHFEGDDQLLILECGGSGQWRGMPLADSQWLETEFNALQHRPDAARSA